MTTPVNDARRTGQEPPELEHPGIFEEHHVVGPDGDDAIETTDDRGRKWYELRPEPRGRADVMGFNRTWWLVFTVLLIIIAFFPW